MTFDAESSEPEGLFLAVFRTIAKGQDGVRRFRRRIPVPVPFPVPHLRMSKTPQLHLSTATTLNRFGTWSKSNRSPWVQGAGVPVVTTPSELAYPAVPRCRRQHLKRLSPIIICSPNSISHFPSRYYLTTISCYFQHHVTFLFSPHLIFSITLLPDLDEPCHFRPLANLPCALCRPVRYGRS